MKYILKGCRLILSVVGAILLFVSFGFGLIWTIAYIVIGLVYGLKWLMVNNPILTLLGFLIFFILLGAYGLKRDEERK